MVGLLEIPSKLEGATSRRIMHEYETKVRPEHFSQPIDIDVTLSGNQTSLMANMPQYPFRSTANAIAFIEELLTLGISSVVLRIRGSLYGPDDDAVIRSHGEAIRLIREHFPKDKLEIVVDPFSIALNKDGTWGVKDQDGNLSYEQTAELIQAITIHFAESGMDSIITLGRIEHEVLLTRQALEKIQRTDIKISSFSQNSETKNAYIYLEHTPDKLDTGQKILVGNFTEMNIQMLTDVLDGSNQVIVKPLENFQLILMAQLLLANANFLSDYLHSPPVQALLRLNESTAQKINRILHHIPQFHELSRKVKVGAYSVSGTYYMQKKIEQEKSERFSYNVVEESLANALASAGPSLYRIIDRNASWFVKQQRSLQA